MLYEVLHAGIVPLYLHALTVILQHTVLAGSSQTFTIGAFLSSETARDLLHQSIDNVNQLDSSPVSFNVTSLVLENNPIRMSQEFCSDVITSGVHVVIVGHSLHSINPPLSISYTCGFYDIPVVGISTRESVFSDKNIHPSFIRTVPPYNAQAALWVDLLVHFKWTSVILIHSTDYEGRSVLSRLQNGLEAHPIQMEKEVPFKPGKLSYETELSSLEDVQSRIVFLYASTQDAAVIYRDAKRLNLTGSGYVWIVTEQALLARNVPLGVLGFHAQDVSNESAQIQDVVSVVTSTFTSIVENENLTDAPVTCELIEPWKSGNTILRYLKKTEIIDGLTGPIRFNNVGDRLLNSYQLINIQSDGSHQVAQYNMFEKPSDRLSFSSDLYSPIVWMGGDRTKPKGLKIKTHLHVVTIEDGIPFISARQIGYGESCDNVTPNTFEVPCRKKANTTKGYIPFCCYGYCMDMLRNLSHHVNFTYDVHLVSDGNFGGTYKPNNSSDRRWNGMIGEILSGEADLIVAPLTITPERARYIDFSKPFKYQGLTILVKREPQNSSLGSFLQPFQMSLWLLVLLSVHVVALVLYLLDRFSPFGQFKLAKTDDTEEDALNLSTAIWFSWGVLLNSGIGEGTPRSFSARVLGMVWAGFAMIIVASYTANLAAFLVLDRPNSAISGIDDPRMRNPVDDYKYATVKNSAVETYFRRRVELSTMYRTMEKWSNFENAAQGIKAVKDGSYKAFIWDSSRLEYEAARDCDLKTVEGLFGRNSLGIGMKQNSPWKEQLSLTILNFHENGTMESLDNKWILKNAATCTIKGSSPATLGLTNMAGVFMMVAGGILLGVVLVFIEIAYKRHQGMKEKEQEVARTAAHRWRSNIEKRKFRRKMLLEQGVQMVDEEQYRLQAGARPTEPHSDHVLNNTAV